MAIVASATDKIHEDFGNQFYIDKIIQHLETFKNASGSEIDDLIILFLPLILSINQKKNKVKYLFINAIIINFELNKKLKIITHRNVKILKGQSSHNCLLLASFL